MGLYKQMSFYLFDRRVAMSQQNQHQMIETCTIQVKQAYQMIEQAKTNGDMRQLQEAEQELRQAEENLHAAQERFGTAALENPQFQQTQEHLHDARQEIEHFRQNHK